MLKALVFLSVIISLANSAPYGSYGGSAIVNSGSAIVDSSSLNGGGSLGISLDGGRIDTGFATKDIGLGEVRHEFAAAPLSSSNFVGSSVVGVGAPIVQRVESEPVMFHESRPLPVEVVTQAPFISHEVFTQAPFISHEISHELAPQTLSFSVLKSSGSY